MKIEKLGKFIRILSGFPFKSELFNTDGEGMPLIRVRDVNSGFSGQYYSGTYSNEYLIKNGDLLIGLDGDFRCVNWSEGEALLNQRVCKIQVISPHLNERYLRKFLPNALLDIHSKTTFTTVKHLSTKTISDIQIPLPPLEDQVRIAHLLGKVEVLIAQRKKDIEQLDQLLKSVFLEMFGDPVRNEKGWEVCNISEVCEEIVDCVNKTAPVADFATPYIMIRTSNIRHGKISLEKVKHVDAATYAIWTRRLVPQKGDILFTREAPMGEIGMITTEDKVFLGQRIMQFRFKSSKMNSIFALHQMQSEFFLQQIGRLGKGSTVKHIAVPDCFKFKVFRPTLDLQNRFASIVEHLEVIKSYYQKSLSDLETLYSALSQKAFQGELDLSCVPVSREVQNSQPAKINSAVPA